MRRIEDVLERLDKVRKILAGVPIVVVLARQDLQFCLRWAAPALKEASREQVENFIDHVADWAATDKNALVCQLNSYVGQKEGVA